MALSIPGVDYAWGSVPYDALKRGGFKFAMRYISHDAGKDLTLGEKVGLETRGLSVGVVYESTATRALAGHAAGVEDARYADGRVKALGLAGIPIYFACDFDATEAQEARIADYLRGAASVLGKARVGVYGSFYVVRHMHDHGVCDWFWQTYAWSGGQVHPAAHVYQWRNGVSIGGLSCDLNRASSDGMRSMRGPAKRPSPAYIAYLRGRLRLRAGQLGVVEKRRKYLIHRVNVLKKKLHDRGVNV